MTRASTRAALAALCTLVAATELLARSGPERAGSQPATPVAPAAPAATLDELWNRAVQALRRASEEREPPLVPPRPVEVRWQARRVGSIDLGAPLLALSARDLDGDERAELIALTSHELVIIERRGHRKLDVRARAPLPAEPAAIRPRDPVGALSVADLDGDGVIDIAARSSEQARGAVFEHRQGALVEHSRFDGFLLCPGVVARLDPGRNYFTRVDAPAESEPAGEPAARPAASVFDLADAFGKDLPERFFAARCRDDLVDPAGRRVSVISVLENDGTLHLWARRRCPRDDAGCEKDAIAFRTLADNGVAHEIVDVNRDGHLEVVVTAKAPPGDPDRVTVLSWQKDRLKRLFGRDFSGGVVGLTSGDIDGDGAGDLVAAVRLWGSNRVDLWTFH